MDFYQYLSAIRRSWVWIVALTLLGVIAGGLLAMSQPKEYRSTASLFVTAGQAESANELAQGSTYVQNLVVSYTTLATSAIVLEPVVKELSLPMSAGALAAKVHAQAPPGTVIINVEAVDADPARAQRIAAASATSLTKAVDNVSPKTKGGDSSISLTLIAPAQTPSSPSSPNLRVFFGVGTTAGLAAGLVVAMIRWANRSARGARTSRPRNR